ncbi:hypothetical protein Pmani_004319 [Petrolisthes manimaculis]|uniref:Integrase catalytic domain-containing protein n=1 Tax=Petrolisthes manimaculis TaxID=1843537 RepID=A0AAE1QF25_9EUCA|nr:hypothetical protein Pmani_004319 [Petrolisthes manimaculis]
MKEFWPALRIVHGKPRYPHSQGSFERANGDIKDMLVAWLTDNESQDWVAGIKFVQFQKNSSHHAGIKRSPYSALFGKEARVGQHLHNHEKSWTTWNLNTIWPDLIWPHLS